MLSLANIFAASLQIACIAAAAGVASAALPITAPRLRYGFWRLVLALCLALPWLQTAPPVASATSTRIAEPPTMSGVVADASVSTVTPIDWAFWLEVLILSGICVRGTWIAVGCLRLRRLRVAGDPVPAAEHDRLQSTLATRADVRYVATVRQPVTFGKSRPVVLLPSALREQTPQIRRAIIAHELVHVRRRDWCWVVAEEFLRAVFWFHPAIWWLISRVQQTREEVVDATVVSITGQRREYMEALLVFADEVPLAPAPAFARRRQLFRRIMRLSTEEVMSARRLIASAAVMAIVVAAAGWTSVRTFPLRSDGATTASQQWTIATLEQPPGPVEQSAKPVTPVNPVPKRIYGEAPLFPASARGDYTSVTVTLRTVVDEAGTVAELRLGGFSFRRGGIGATIDGGQNVGQRFEQFAANAQFRDAGGSLINAESMRPMFEAFIESAADALQRWQYEPPRDGPIVFNTVIQFTDGKPTATGTAAAVTRSADGALRVGGAVKPPVKIKDVKPAYPQEAKDAGIQGVVILELRIEADGHVSDAHVLRSIPALDAAALGAVLQWQFLPTHLNGEAVPVIMTVTVQFSLQ